MAHDFREISRSPVELVRSACSCGCGRQRIQIVSSRGNPVMTFVAPKLPKGIKPEHVGEALSLGRQAFDLFRRAGELARR